MQKYHKYLYLFCKLIKTKGSYYKFLNCRRNHGNKARVNATEKKGKRDLVTHKLCNEAKRKM